MTQRSTLLAALLLAAISGLHRAAATTSEELGLTVSASNAGAPETWGPGRYVDLTLSETVHKGARNFIDWYLDINIFRINSSRMETERLFIDDGVDNAAAQVLRIPSYTNTPLSYGLNLNFTVNAFGRWKLYGVPQDEGEPTPTTEPFAVRVQFSWKPTGRRQYTNLLRSKFARPLKPSSSENEDSTSKEVRYHAPGNSPRLVVTRVSPLKVLFNGTIECGTRLMELDGRGCMFNVLSKVIKRP
jgi:hypothetical protein